MHTVIETPAYLRDAVQAGLSEDERADIVTVIAANPQIGDVIQGTGGFRKARIAGHGKGKSGGYRIVTFYAARDVPVFLITVFSKRERSDLSQAERNELARMARTLVASLKRK